MSEPQITYRGMEHSPAIDSKIRELAAKLDDFNGKITTCHVVVAEVDRHKAKGNHFEVRVDLHLPGRDLISSMKDHEDAYVALHDAFHVVMRKLGEDHDRKRSERKHPATDIKHSTPDTGESPNP